MAMEEPRDGPAMMGDGTDDVPEAPIGFGLSFWLMGVGALVVLAGLLIYARSPGGTDPLGIVDERAVAVTDPSAAPAFSLPSLDGDGIVRAPEPDAKASVLNFWASWCAPCREEAPDLQATFERYRSQGVSFIGINERDNRASALQFATQVGFTFPSAFDPDGRLAFNYELVGMPTTFVVDAAGQIRYRFTGIVDGASLRRALDDVLTSS
jgi:DsbE subfamily thiol:disulfide oxidoreductase